MKNTIVALLIVFCIFSLFCIRHTFIKQIIINPHTEPPPHYRILTDGKEWVWEHDLSPEYPDKWFRGFKTFLFRYSAVNAAWGQYEYELFESTNKWKVQ